MSDVLEQAEPLHLRESLLRRLQRGEALLVLGDDLRVVDVGQLRLLGLQLQGQAGVLGLHGLHLLQPAADGGLGAEQVGLVLVQTGQDVADGLGAPGVGAGGLRRGAERLLQRLEGGEQALRAGARDGERVACRWRALDGDADGRAAARRQADAHAVGIRAAADHPGAGQARAGAAGDRVTDGAAACGRAAEADLVLRAVHQQHLLGEGGVADAARAGGGVARVAAGSADGEGSIAARHVHEQRAARIADGRLEAGAEGQLVLAAVAQILHLTVGLQGEGLGLAFAAGEKVITLAVLRIAVLHQLLQIALHGGGGVLQILRVDGSVVHLHGELPHLVNQGAHALQGRAFKLQRVLRVLAVLLVAGQPVDLPGERDVLRRGHGLVRRVDQGVAGRQLLAQGIERVLLVEDAAQTGGVELRCADAHDVLPGSIYNAWISDWNRLLPT